MININAASLDKSNVLYLAGYFRLGSPRHVESDSNSESSETNSVNTVVTEIRQQFSRQQQQSLHNLDSGHNNPNLSSHTADQHQRYLTDGILLVTLYYRKLVYARDKHKIYSKSKVGRFPFEAQSLKAPKRKTFF